MGQGDEADRKASPSMSTTFFGESGEKRAAVVIGCGMSKGLAGPSDTLHLSEHLGRLTGVQLHVLFSKKGDGEKRREAARIGDNNMQDTR